MRIIAKVLSSLALALALAVTAIAADFDLVINNGRVMDPETKYDGIANVGIKDGKIAVITKDKITGKKTIDAKGLVVAPGFIDTHFHWVRPMGYKLGLRDGVTTGMDLEMGSLGNYADQWYKDRQGKCQMNYGTAVSHEFARSLVLDNATAHDTMEAGESRKAGNNWSEKVVNLEEGNKILRLLDQGLRDGAIGIGSTLGYMRNGVTAREMFEVQRVGANYGRLTSVHLRYTPGTATTEANGAQEVMANAVALGAPAIVAHFNNPGWQLVHELLTRLQKRGFNIWGEIYPYAAGSTALNAVFLQPKIWIEQLGHKYEDTLMDPVDNSFYTRERYEKEVKENPTKVIILFKIPPEQIKQWIKMPGVTVACDSMPVIGDFTWDTHYENLPNTHPRGAGAHALALRLARENNVPLMQVLSMLSYTSAKHLGDTGLEAMKVRGRLQKGMVADITIFDPAKVTDNSTYEKGTLPSTGIPYVLVNGVVVVKDSKVLKGVNPGQPIRFKPEAKGRFTPLSAEEWEKNYLGAPVDFCQPAPERH